MGWDNCPTRGGTIVRLFKWGETSVPLFKCMGQFSHFLSGVGHLSHFLSGVVQLSYFFWWGGTIVPSGVGQLSHFLSRVGQLSHFLSKVGQLSHIFGCGTIVPLWVSFRVKRIIVEDIYITGFLLVMRTWENLGDLGNGPFSKKTWEKPGNWA